MDVGKAAQIKQTSRVTQGETRVKLWCTDLSKAYKTSNFAQRKRCTRTEASVY